MPQSDRAKRKAEKRRTWLLREIARGLEERNELIATHDSLHPRHPHRSGIRLDIAWLEATIAEFRQRVSAYTPRPYYRREAAIDEEAA